MINELLRKLSRSDVLKFFIMTRIIQEGNCFHNNKIRYKHL